MADTRAISSIPTAQYLDLAGLGVYDALIKGYIGTMLGTGVYSDKRLKSNISLSEGVLTKITTLNTYTYYPNQKAVEAGMPYKKEIGLLAHEVKEVFPEIVKVSPLTDKINDGEVYETIDYARLSAILVAGIKELTDKVNYLEMELNKLRVVNG